MCQKNNNCDGAHCKSAKGEVRVLPYSDDSNGILCKDCYNHEMKFRQDWNDGVLGKTLDKFDIPSWESLKVYNPDE